MVVGKNMLSLLHISETDPLNPAVFIDLDHTLLSAQSVC